ncbi:MAG: NFACT family protein, partial [Planctomycetota bacterium]|nr:NFACT family protein [Planctomycetota bacterium]
MALSARHIGELIGELRPLLEGLVVLDVEALPPRDLLLVLEDAGGVRRLRLSADPVAPRIHLQSARVRSHRGPVGPFFRRAKDELSGRRIVTVEQVGDDRIVRLVLDGGAERRLLAELVGRHANLVLADGDERVLAVLVPHRPDKARLGPRLVPRLVIGGPWTPPPGRPTGRGGPSLREAFDL